MPKTNPTVGEMIERIQQQDLRHEVYAHLVEHLAQFISTDTHEPKHGIVSQITGVVPEETIQSVKDELEILATDIKTEALKLRNNVVSDKRRTNVKKTAKAKTRKNKKAANRKKSHKRAK